MNASTNEPLTVKAGLLNVTDGTAYPDSRRGKLTVGPGPAEKTITIRFSLRPTDQEIWSVEVEPYQVRAVYRRPPQFPRVLTLRDIRSHTRTTAAAQPHAGGDGDSLENTQSQSPSADGEHGLRHGDAGVGLSLNSNPLVLPPPSSSPPRHFGTRHLWIQEVDPADDDEIIQRLNDVLQPPVDALSLGGEDAQTDADADVNMDADTDGLTSADADADADSSSSSLPQSPDSKGILSLSITPTSPHAHAVSPIAANTPDRLPLQQPLLQDLSIKPTMKRKNVIPAEALGLGEGAGATPKRPHVQTLPVSTTSSATTTTTTSSIAASSVDGAAQNLPLAAEAAPLSLASQNTTTTRGDSEIVQLMSVPPNTSKKSNARPRQNDLIESELLQFTRTASSSAFAESSSASTAATDTETKQPSGDSPTDTADPTSNSNSVTSTRKSDSTSSS